MVRRSRGHLRQFRKLLYYMYDDNTNGPDHKRTPPPRLAAPQSQFYLWTCVRNKNHRNTRTTNFNFMFTLIAYVECQSQLIIRTECGAHVHCWLMCQWVYLVVPDGSLNVAADSCAKFRVNSR
jgi:hypothetical protein